MTLSKTVLITGAAIRVGRAMAIALADDGWNVAIHYHRSHSQAQELQSLLHSKGGKAWLVQADLSDSAAVAQMIPQINAQGVTIDCLINNAAVFEKDELATLTKESWQRHTEINLFAPLQLMRDFAAQYTGDSGNIINITDSVMGWSISPEFLSYSLSKLALTQATQLLVKELAPHIRINAVAPGPTLKGVQDKEDTYEKMKASIPLQCTSSPEEVCAAVRYILTAPSFTGQVIALSGGLSHL